MASPPILQAARDLFPKSAGTITVTHAWRPQDSTLERPLGVGPDGWTPTHGYATRPFLLALQEQGFTHVALHPARTVNNRSPVAIAGLLG
jgi:hypothetical protein